MQSMQSIELDVELYNKLLKCGIFRSSPKSKANHDKKKIMLDPDNQGLFENGLALGKYLIVLKDLLKKNNQDLNIDVSKMQTLKSQINPQSRLFNWNIICNELDKIGISIDPDNRSLAVAGDQEQINQIFQRIERFLTKIAGKQILNFDNFRVEPQMGIASLENNTQINGNARRGIKPNQKKKIIKDGVDILTMNPDREPIDTESTLELILNTLCRAFQMKPKQAAALLTNNNQFLIHSIVKGVKGKYEPLISWYQDLYANSKYLTGFLELEQEQFPNSTNFKKVLSTLSCGLYSQNIEICKWCSKLVSKIGYDFQQNQTLFEQAMQWFLDKEGGLELSLHALKKHPDLAEEFVLFVNQFSTVNDQIQTVYKTELKKYFSSPLEYVSAINDLLPYISSQCNQEIRNSGILDFWLESCLRQADNDGKHSYDERIAALTLLSEIWMCYTDYVDQKEELQNQVLQILKRGARDRHRPVRMVTICELFRLLDKFSEEKNQSAPAIYKTLIFSLVENPQDPTIRDLYLVNFIQLFEANPSIPVGLLSEPLIKQIQVSEGVTFFYKIFDFDFFAYLAKHPKLKVENAIPLVDLLAKVYLNDISYASISCVPFMLVCSRMIQDEAIQEFVIKFITIGLSMLMGLEKNAEELQSKHQQLMAAKEGVGRGSQKRILALPAPPIPPPAKKIYGKKMSKEEKMKKQKEQEEEVERRLKKTYIVEIIMKIQNLRNEDINDQLRDMLLSTNKRFNELYGFFNKGIMALLKWWGDPEQVMNSYIRAIEEKEQRERDEQEMKERIEREKQRREQEEKERKEQQERDKRQQEVQEKLRLMAAEGKDTTHLEEEERRLLLGYDSSDQLKNDEESYMNGKNSSIKNSLAVLPYQASQRTGAVKNYRAVQEIEKIKQSKLQQEEQKRLEEERRRLNSERRKKKLKEQLERRKVELGVGAKSQTNEIKALIYNNDSNAKDQALKQKLVQPQIKLVDLEEEEERDKEAVLLFMKKYSKLWRNLFYKYANSGYSAKQINNFDQLSEKLNTMNVAEMTKMLKDHNTYPQLITKDELLTLFRLINTKVVNSNDLQALEYNGYFQFMMQLAFFCFTRPPKDLSHLPPVESIRQLVLHFELATRDRGNSTVLYEDPDATDVKDKDLIRALNDKLQQDPTYPIPEGYMKQTEKTPIYEYRIPENAANLMSESQIISVELLDDFVNGLFGFHFLEPLVSFQERLKVKPMIRNQYKPQAEALNYMKKVEKKIKPIEDRLNDFGLMSAQQKRQAAMEIKPKLNVTLRLEVAQYPIKERPHAQDVAEVLEELLQATEKGLSYLPPRLNRAPGQIYNDAKKKKDEDTNKDQEMKNQKEQKRVKRDTAVKSELNKIKEEKDKMFEEQKKQREEQERKEREMKKKKWLEAKKQIEDKRRGFEQQKQTGLEEIQKKREEEEQKNKDLNEKKKKDRTEFLKNQKQKMQEEFGQLKKDREDLIIAKQEAVKIKKEHEQRIRQEMEEFIKESQQDRDKEKEERKTIHDFLHQPDVNDVFSMYEKSLQHMFKFYASQDKKDVGFNLEKSMNSINIREFIRFGFQQNIVPALLHPEDMVHIFRELIREKVAEVKDGLEDNYLGDKNFDSSFTYDYFKKALIRIAMLAQDSLGGQKEDLLLQKLEEEAKNNHEERVKRQREKQDNNVDNKDYLETEGNTEEQPIADQNKQQQNSEQQDNNESNNKQKVKESVVESYEINQTKKQKEDAFFDKWVKQREAQGISLKKRIIGNEKDGGKKIITKKKKKVVITEGQDVTARRGNKSKKDAAQSNEMEKVREGEDFEGTSQANLQFQSPAGNRKTKTQKELLALQEQVKAADTLKSLKIENKKIKKDLGAQIITAKTIEALMQFLGIKPDDNRYILDKKLNEVRIEIQGQKPNRIKKQLKPNKLESIREHIDNNDIQENQQQEQLEEIQQEEKEENEI